MSTIVLKFSIELLVIKNGGRGWGKSFLKFSQTRNSLKQNIFKIKLINNFKPLNKTLILIKSLIVKNNNY